MAAVQVMAHSGGGYATDRTPFFGIRVPPEIKKLVQLSKTVDQATFKKTLKIVVQYLETGVGEEESLTALQSEKCPQETVRAMFAGIHTVLTAALKQPSLKPAIIKEDLQLIKMPAEMIADLSSAVSGSRRSRLERSVLERRVRLPQLSTLRWRVDVTISNSSLHRLLEPSILMEMTLSDGSVKTFEVTVSQFHELRYSVAYVLKEMEDLENRNILKLQD